MYRLAYRNFGDHEALVVNHSVVAGGSVGVRWYEIRSPYATPTVYQQGTYAPDSDYRWMGSMAMDHAGNIALGYGVSSGSTYPSIRYTAHATTDPLNQMETESAMAAGAGYQQGNRWGDYSSFSVDPVDDCTLWYTHEYLTGTGNFNWETRVGTIKFANCTTGGGTPTLSVAAAPSSLSVAQGSSKNSTITTAGGGGFNASVALTASGLPSGASASFNLSTIAAPGSGSSTLSLTAGPTTPTGTSNVTVTGTGGGVTASTSIAFTVTSSGGGGTTNVVTDGGFESATASGPTAPGWTSTTNIAGHNVIAYHGSYPHTGTNYAFLGGSNSEADTLTQTVSIPANATAASLTFWTNIVTQEAAGSPVYDTMAVEIHNSSGTLLGTPLTLSNVNYTSDNNTNGTYFQPAAVSLLSYAGQTVQLVFHVKTDTSLPTTFRVDDIILNVTTPGGGTPPVTSITAPANNATVSGTTTITVTASDPAGVTKIELYIDGSLITSDTNATSLSYAWNTTAVANGSHSLQSKAYDATGLVGTSAAVSVTVNNGGGNPQQLLVNPGFEQGSTNPAPWTVTAGVISNSASEPPHTGVWNAWLDGYGAAHTDSILQTVTIPSTITTATLSFWLHIDTAETTTTQADDTLKVQIRNSSGTVLATLGTYSNLTPISGYTQVSFNLAAYKGQTVQVYLVGTENASLQTSFVVDDFALNVQ